MRKRSKYRPKGVIVDTLSFVKAGLSRVGSISSGLTLKIINHEALEAVRKGHGTRDDIDKLITALNVTEALAVNLRYGEDWKDEIRAAQDALLELGRRGAETGKFILRGPELTSLNLAMEIHDEQLDACTVLELEKAHDVVKAAYRTGNVRTIIQKR